ncbi:MAG: hypothetical protein H0V70_26270 [Ktedonobacteraceae bacterium]|nr:hypothetical protein [Ktedonobacteraceae bacterium]
MKSGRRLLLLLLLVASLTFLWVGWIPSPAFAATSVPNELLITRTPGLNTVNSSSREVVLHALLVKQLYTHMISLPSAPEGQICPQYLIASYRLTFYHNFVPVLQAKAVDGLCHPVIFGSSDIRAADASFWKLLKQAQDVGIGVHNELKLPNTHQIVVPPLPIPTVDTLHAVS